jgi:hypothetical protein
MDGVVKRDGLHGVRLVAVVLTLVLSRRSPRAH